MINERKTGKTDQIKLMFTSAFRGNPFAALATALGGALLIPAINLNNENEFFNEFTKYVAHIPGVAFIGMGLVMWRRTGWYYYLTIQAYKKMKREGYSGDIIGRLEKHFKDTPNGCKSFGMQLAIEDLKKHGDKFK